jgi:thiamine pyrophosphate-dependent acetolactate synthase large subunit-like protein
MLVVMFNNRAYYQDVGHQTAITRLRERALDHIGVGVSLEHPATDFGMLARSFGLYGQGPVVDPEAIRPALDQAIQVVKQERRLGLVDVVTQPR